MKEKFDRNNIEQIILTGRIQLEAEDLNNEGTIGNIVQPRQLTLSDNSVRQAISGEMQKHNFTSNLRRLADDDELCTTCKIFSPMKNGEIPKAEIDNELSDTGNRVKKCIIDDVCGFMNAGKGRNEKRESIFKCSTLIAIEDNEYEMWLHTRNTSLSEENKTKKKDLKKQSDEDVNINKGNTISEQTTQMLYHKPLRSNIYAFTIQVDLHRIGVDEENEVYTLTQEEINERKNKVLQALKNTLINIEGANCNTQLPHCCNIEGVLIEKRDKNDVLVKYSALKDDYKEVNSRIASHSKIFNNIEEFVTTIDSLKK